MSQRTKVVGTRSFIVWLLIIIVVVMIAALAVGGLVVYPHLQDQRAEQARLAEVERHYQAGVAFQDVGDWEAAEVEFKQVVTLSANYKDTKTRLAEVKAKLVEVETEITRLTPTTTATPVTKVVYSNDFEGVVGSGWSNTSRNTTPSGRRFLGEFGDGTVSLTLNSLPPHTFVTVSFDLFIIRSWDGNQLWHLGDPNTHSRVGPDVWDLNVGGGPTLLHTTFSNVMLPLFSQAYPDAYPGGDHPVCTGATENNTLGYTLDAVYQLSFTFSHSASSLALNFSASGLEGLENESWGLDNVEVSVIESKSP